MTKEILAEQAFAEIIARNGGRAFRVGGCVRDYFMGVIPKDIDFCVVGMVKKNFKLLFPKAEECGKKFPVFRLEIDGIKREVAFARTERKAGMGYKGFKVSTKPTITIEEDLFRRDTTVNSMAQDSLTGEIIDPFHGKEDISAGILRATSSHFSDDPIRVLRLAGQAARFGFAIDPATLLLAIAAGDELVHEPVERMAAEMKKVLAEAPEPGRFFRVLSEVHVLHVIFKEIAVLATPDFEKMMEGLNAVAKATSNPKLRFAAFGLGLDSEKLALWNQRMTLPGSWLESADTVSRMIRFLAQPTPEILVAAITKLQRGSLGIEEFDLIIKAAGVNIPELRPLKAVMALSPSEAVPGTLKGRHIGEWLRNKQVQAVQEQWQPGKRS